MPRTASGSRYWNPGGTAECLNRSRRARPHEPADEVARALGAGLRNRDDGLRAVMFHPDRRARRGIDVADNHGRTAAGATRDVTWRAGRFDPGPLPSAGPRSVPQVCLVAARLPAAACHTCAIRRRYAETMH